MSPVQFCKFQLSFQVYKSILKKFLYGIYIVFFVCRPRDYHVF